MKLTAEQREKIISLFPKQRGNVVVDADHYLDALMYLVHNGCTWCSLPAVFGPWTGEPSFWFLNGVQPGSAILFSRKTPGKLLKGQGILSYPLSIIYPVTLVK